MTARALFRITSWIMPLLLSFSLFTAEAGDMVIKADQQFAYADSLYLAKDYSTAQVEFKRFIHFFPKDTRQEEAEFKTADSLFHTGQFRQAAELLNQIILRDRQTSFTMESYFLQSKAFMEMGNTGYAQIVLQNFLKLTRDAQVQDRIYNQLAGYHISQVKGLGNTKSDHESLEQAQNYLSLISDTGADRYQRDKKKKRVKKAMEADEKDPVLAGLFSIVPGGGFLYCGRYKDAFISFCLNAGMIYAAYEAFDNSHYALGGVIAFVETGLYAGNIYGSVSAAHKHNKRQRIKILDMEFDFESALDPGNSQYLFSLTSPF